MKKKKLIPIFKSKRWTNRLLRLVRGKLVRVVYLDNPTGQVGIAIQKGDEMFLAVDGQLGQSIDAPFQIVEFKILKAYETPKTNVRNNRRLKPSPSKSRQK